MSFTTTLTPDQPIVIDADEEFDTTDRRYIDNQIIGLQSTILQLLASGVVASWYTVDNTSTAISIGDAICGSSAGGTVFQAVGTPIAVANGAFGIALTSGSPGARVLVATAGQIPQTVTGITTVGLNSDNAVGYVDGSSPRLQRQVRTGATGFYVLGSLSVNGALTILPQPGTYVPPGGGGGGGGTVPTGTGFTHITGSAQDAAARAVSLNSADVTGVLPIANQASQAMAGDASGTTAANTVSAIRNITIPAPTTAGTTLTYTANTPPTLAWVAAPAGSVPTGTGFTHITGGAQDTAARAISLASADVTGTLPVTLMTSASGPYTAGQVLTLATATTATWQTPIAGGSGVPSRTTNTSSFLQPSVGTTVSVSVGASGWMQVGMSVVVAGGGFYTVATISSSTAVSFTLSVVGTGGTATGGTVASGSIISMAPLAGNDLAANQVVTGIRGASIPVLSNGVLTSTGGVLSWAAAGGSSNATQLQGTTINATAPTTGQFFGYDGTTAKWFSPSGDVTYSTSLGAGTVTALGSTTAIPVTGPGLMFAAAQVTPALAQTANATNGATAAPMAISAQSATGTTSTGGELTLSSGSGTSANGGVNLKSGGTNGARLDPTNGVTAYSYNFTSGRSFSAYYNGGSVLAGIATDSAGSMYIGTDSAFATAVMPTNLYLNGYNKVILCYRGSGMFAVLATSIQSSLPIVGDSSASPYGAHGATAAIAVTSALTLNAAQFAMQKLNLNCTTAATVTIPAVSSNAGYYEKSIYNSGTAIVTISTGSGTTVAVGIGKRLRIGVDTAGVEQITPAQ